MDKVATTNVLEKTLSPKEKGDASDKATSYGILQTIKPESDQTPESGSDQTLKPKPNHSSLLDSLLQATNPKPEASKEVVLETPAPGVSTKSSKEAKISATAAAPVSEEVSKPSEDLLAEKAHSAVKEWIEEAKAQGKDPAQIESEIAAFAKEQTEAHKIPTDADLKGVQKEDAIEMIDEEAQKAKTVTEGLHPEEGENMGLLSGISAKIATLGKTAADNPFAKKDDDKKDEDKDKKPAPFEKKDDEKKDEDKKPFPFEKKDDKKEDEKKTEPKSDDKKEDKKPESKKDSESDDKSDIKKLKEALKIMEDFLSKEVKDGEAGPEVEIARSVVEGIKEIAGDEVKEKADDMGMPKAPEMKAEGPESPIEKMGDEPKDMFGGEDLAKDTKDTMAPPPMGGLKPMPVVKPMPLMAFKAGDRVFLREASDEEPGKVIAACANNKYVIDWGTEVPTEEDGRMLIKADDDAHTGNLFSKEVATEIESVRSEGGQMAAYESEETQVLSGMSFSDAMMRMSEDHDDNCDVMHIGSGLKGRIVSSASDRFVVDFGGNTGEYWPHEVKMFSRD